jgi:hypothetical protein
VKNTCLKWFDLRLQDFLVSILVGYLCLQVMLEHPHKNLNPDNIGEQVYTPFSAVGEFPLTTHVGGNADQEVEADQLIRAAVVQPLIEGSSFPDGVEVQANGV